GKFFPGQSAEADEGNVRLANLERGSGKTLITGFRIQDPPLTVLVAKYIQVSPTSVCHPTGLGSHVSLHQIPVHQLVTIPIRQLQKVLRSLPCLRRRTHGWSSLANQGSRSKEEEPGCTHYNQISFFPGMRPLLSPAKGSGVF